MRGQEIHAPGWSQTGQVAARLAADPGAVDLPERVSLFGATALPHRQVLLLRYMQELGYAEIAAALAISPRTVEVHKARMMDKLGVGSVAELVRLSLS